MTSSAADQRIRTCIATGQSGAPELMIRFALAPGGIVTPDIAEKLPGRGAWVAASQQALEKAVKKGGFSRGFAQKVETPEGLIAQVEAGLLKAAMNALGLANRAGLVVSGFEKARAALSKGDAAMVLTARDGAHDGAEKIRRLAGATVRCAAFSAQELTQALGRERVVHVVVRQGQATGRFVREARRVEAFRGAV
ncbi:MAG: RNA-binding protein [Pseudomonadota bacterium]